MVDSNQDEAFGDDEMGFKYCRRRRRFVVVRLPRRIVFPSFHSLASCEHGERGAAGLGDKRVVVVVVVTSSILGCWEVVGGGVRGVLSFASSVWHRILSSLPFWTNCKDWES